MNDAIATIFKAYDIRGKVGTELTPEVCERVGKAMAAWLPTEGTVAVGRDMRPDSAELAAAMINGLRAGGRNVWDIGEVTSDMIYFAVGHNNLAGGAMITASHNPGADNGIKLCREEAKPIGIESGLADIKDAVINGTFEAATTEGTLTEKKLDEDWVTHVLGFVSADSWPKYKVAIDAGNGMAGAIIPSLQPKVPLDVIPMYFELDGTFPNHIANPLIPENLVDLQAKISETGADFGIAFDGDGDRAALIDEKGEALTGTVMTAILSKYFLSKNPGSTILYNAICGRIVPETVEANGGTAIRTKVGHSYIKAKMREHDAVFAGEHSGHYYFKDNFYADSGLIAAMVAIQVLANSGKKLSELAEEFRSAYAAMPETNFHITDKQAAIDKLKAQFADAEQNELDGLTVNFPDGWLNVRASNTESVIRLNVEARTAERVQEIFDKAKAILETVS
jgi:phosphomannomutase